MSEERKENAEQAPLDLLTILVHTIYATLSFGCAGSALTIFFVPLPMIANHLRLAEPWPKITALLGAVVALFFFGMPAEVVCLIFVFGMLVGDGVRSKKYFWQISVHCIGVSIGIVGAFTVWNAQLQRLSVLEYWRTLVDKMMENYVEIEMLREIITPERLKNTIFFEGPFIFLTGLVLCLWASVGFASHLGWFEKTHKLSPDNLRKIRLPMWLFVMFGFLFIGKGFSQPPFYYWVEGVFLFISVLILIQGCVYLSVLMSKKRMKRPAKIAIYVLSFTFGYYVLMGLGVFGQWFINRIENIKNVEVQR